MTQQHHVPAARRTESFLATQREAPRKNSRTRARENENLDESANNRMINCPAAWTIVASALNKAPGARISPLEKSFLKGSLSLSLSSIYTLYRRREYMYRKFVPSNGLGAMGASLSRAKRRCSRSNERERESEWWRESVSTTKSDFDWMM